MANRADITPELCRQLLRYEPETGKLFWRQRPREMFMTQRSCSVWHARYADKEAFTCTRRGYRLGPIFCITFSAHRVAWAIIHGVWPTHEIDHIDGDKSNNRIANLRDVPTGINQQNTRRRKDNKSGMTGVCWNRGKWLATISVDAKMIHLGRYSKFEDAAAARMAAQIAHGFHENHGRA